MANLSIAICLLPLDTIFYWVYNVSIKMKCSFTTEWETNKIMETLLDFLKTLEVKPRKTKNGFYTSYAPRALSLGIVELTPKPTAKELKEAMEWLKKNKLDLPATRGELKFLIKDSDDDNVGLSIHKQYN